LLYTGCRPSEALALTAARVDFHAEVLTCESLKKRRMGIYRAVPVPAVLLDALGLVHGIRDRKTRERLWPWSRKTASTRVIEVMERAGGDERPGGLACLLPFGTRRDLWVARPSQAIRCDLGVHSRRSGGCMWSDALARLEGE
jgi:integrase